MNENIIADINVTDCAFYNNGKCNNPNGMSCNCANTASCYFKELNCLEQENKDLKERLKKCTCKIIELQSLNTTMKNECNNCEKITSLKQVNTYLKEILKNTGKIIEKQNRENERLNAECYKYKTYYKPKRVNNGSKISTKKQLSEEINKILSACNNCSVEPPAMKFKCPECKEKMIADIKALFKPNEPHIDKIVINDVDVTSCFYLTKVKNLDTSNIEYEEFRANYAEYQCALSGLACELDTFCHYKQLQALKSENDEFLNQLEFLVIDNSMLDIDKFKLIKELINDKKDV